MIVIFFRTQCIPKPLAFVETAVPRIIMLPQARAPGAVMLSVCTVDPTFCANISIFWFARIRKI